ncbi:YoaK family protein [Levilactobacillus andaensis]|uniref:YoaK family protein n=1 Tax=Levilactobacillus andaensis TaxID=2799570 RepID=UPI0019408168|nr:YoaK family protein [Levilactobacillus andaensis]
MRQQAYPAHEQLLFGSGLTMVAGALDAYSYLEHGEVFAGLQTGNLILLGINLGKLQVAVVGRYLTAMIAFMVGTMLIRGLQHFLEKKQKNLQATVLWIELVLLVCVAITTSILPDIAITALLSLTAAAELQAFRKLKGAPFTPLMMTGNFRAVAESLFDGVRYRDKAARTKATDTLAVMGSFALGAAIVGLFSKTLQGFTVVIPIIILVALIVWLRQQTQQRRWKH